MAALPESTDTCYCTKCKKVLNAKNFYSSHNLEKYPNGRINICKKCITMLVDVFDPETFTWILQECDVPYIPDEWNSVILRWQKDGSVSPSVILGRYLSKLKVKQWKDYRWKDNELIQQLKEAQIESTMRRQGYDYAEIAKTLQTGVQPIPVGNVPIPDLPEQVPELSSSNSQPASPEEDYFAQQAGADDFNDDLTDEDRTYLRLKWGKAYKPEEWIKLEQLYEEMTASYDIQGAGHVDILKLVCKTSLKANQLLDIGDVDGAQKMTKMYDSLMKAGSFKRWTMKNFSNLLIRV